MITNCSITSIYKCFLQTYNCKYMIKLTVVTKQKHNSSQFCLQTQENYILRLRVYITVIVHSISFKRKTCRL